MAFKVLRGNTAQVGSITPAEGELVYNTQTKKLIVGDGTTAGGVLVDAPASLTFTGVASDIISDVTNTRDIGSSAIKWAEGHFTTVFGALTGNVTGNVTGDTAGVHTGAVTGAVTGSLTGNVTGNITGVVTGTAGSTLIGDVTGNLIGAVAGDLIASDTTTMIDAVSKTITANEIFGSTGATLQINTNSVIAPVVIGSTVNPQGLYIYADNSNTGGPESTLTISGVSAQTEGTRFVFETVVHTGTLAAPTDIQAGNVIGSIEFRGLIGGLVPSANYRAAGQIIGEAISTATHIKGNIIIAVGEDDGTVTRFNMAANGAFNSLSAIFGVAGDLATPGYSNIPADVALDVRGITKLEIRTAPPASPVDGMITIQDGATWDPAGTGVQAVVAYINGGWVKLN